MSTVCDSPDPIEARLKVGESWRSEEQAVELPLTADVNGWGPVSVRLWTPASLSVPAVKMLPGTSAQTASELLTEGRAKGLRSQCCTSLTSKKKRGD